MSTEQIPITDTPFEIAGRTLRSRLILGTGGFPRLETLAEAIRATRAELVTVALRRIDPAARGSLVDVLERLRRRAAAQHRRLLHRARRGASPRGWRARRSRPTGSSSRSSATSARCCPTRPSCCVAAEELVDDGFVVLPYTNDDPILARRLEDVGCAAVMPLGSPIGSGMGIRNPYNLALIVERAGVPVILDAGVGTASDAALAMELGCDGVLCASAIARAQDPVAMAHAIRAAVEAGPPGPRRRAHPAPPARRGLLAGGRAGRPHAAGRVIDDARSTAGRPPGRAATARRSRRSARPTSTTRTRCAASRSRAPTRSADHAARLWAAFPDARIERTGERLTDGRFVAAPCKLLGTHRGELEGLRAHRALRRRARSSSTASSTPTASGCGACARSSTPTTPRSSSACCPRAARWASARCFMLRGFGLRARG